MNKLICSQTALKSQFGNLAPPNNGCKFYTKLLGFSVTLASSLSGHNRRVGIVHTIRKADFGYQNNKKNRKEKKTKNKRETEHLSTASLRLGTSQFVFCFFFVLPKDNMQLQKHPPLRPFCVFKTFVNHFFCELEPDRDDPDEPRPLELQRQREWHSETERDRERRQRAQDTLVMSRYGLKKEIKKNIQKAHTPRADLPTERKNDA